MFFDIHVVSSVLLDEPRFGMFEVREFQVRLNTAWGQSIG